MISPDDLSFIWIGHRGEDSDVLTWAGPIAGIACCDYSQSLASGVMAGSVTSIEQQTGERSLWSSASLKRFEQHDLERLILRSSTAGHPHSVIVPYKVTRGIERAVEHANGLPLLLAGPRAEVVEALDDKAEQRRLFQSSNVPTPKWWTVSRVDYENQCGGKEAEPLIVQRTRGSLGRDTRKLPPRAPIRNLPAEWLQDDELLVSEYIDGPIVNVTGAVCARQIRISRPSIQLTGLTMGDEGTPQEFLYYGNDFVAALSLSDLVVSQLRSLVGVVAGQLFKRGFLGIFGMDFVLGPRGPLALEINPRFQGSTPLLTSLEVRDGAEPTVLGHLEAFGIRPSFRVGHDPAGPLYSSEIVMYTGHEGVAHDVDRILPDEATVRGLPVAGTKVLGGAALGRLRLAGSVLSEDLRTVRQDVVRLMNRISRSVLSNEVGIPSRRSASSPIIEDSSTSQ